MRIEAVDSFNVKRSHTFFFDSNIWLYLIYPQDNQAANRLIKKYSAFNNLVAKRDCLILTNLIQMSELINVIVHKEHKRFQEQKKTHVNLKNYRASEDGKAALVKARTFTSQIMKLATLQSGIFNSEEMGAMVSNCDKADFNDIYFARFCEKQSAILVTHDFDFRALDQDVIVVSANNRYLS